MTYEEQKKLLVASLDSTIGLLANQISVSENRELAKNTHMAFINLLNQIESDSLLIKEPVKKQLLTNKFKPMELKDTINNFTAAQRARWNIHANAGQKLHDTVQGLISEAEITEVNNSLSSANALSSEDNDQLILDLNAANKLSQRPC